jgi:hypothetical protein
VMSYPNPPRPRNAGNIIMPAFVFARRRDIELTAGFILAGRLVMDVPKPAEGVGRKMPKHVARKVDEIIRVLATRALSGRTPDYTVAYGWPGECKPPNAVATDDDAVMTAWANTRLVIDVTVVVPRALDLLPVQP